MKAIFPVLISILILSACNKKATTGSGNSSSSSPQTESTENNTMNPESTVTDIKTLVKGNNQFAFELYSAIRSPKENIIVSPYSVSSALAMTYAGARNNTEKQMSEVLHFRNDQNIFHNEFKSLAGSIKDLNMQKGIELYIANSLWAQKNYKFRDEFFNIVKNNYNAGLQYVDFSKDADKSRSLINKWVEDQTKQRIKELLKPGSIDAGTKLVLTNAIYFYGNWAIEFNENETFETKFYSSAESSVIVPFMKIQEEYRFFENEKYKALELPYSGEKLSMLIILPPGKEDLEQFVKGLNTDLYKNTLSSMTKRKVDVLIPRFKITSSFDLEDNLQEMGMKDAFSGSADFSGMTGKKELQIDKVIHKAFFEVNEKGTEAAASTAVTMRKSAVVMPVFRADHPFLFFLKDNETGSILFMGQVVNPH